MAIAGRAEQLPKLCCAEVTRRVEELHHRLARVVVLVEAENEFEAHVVQHRLQKRARHAVWCGLWKNVANALQAGVLVEDRTLEVLGGGVKVVKPEEQVGKPHAPMWQLDAVQ